MTGWFLRAEEECSAGTHFVGMRFFVAFQLIFILFFVLTEIILDF